MRILLDECIDEALRHHFPGHECQTCRFASLKGLSNGALLAAAEAGFEILITVDQNIPHQQNVTKSAISVVVLRAPTTNIDDLIPLVPELERALTGLKASQVIIVER